MAVELLLVAALVLSVNSLNVYNVDETGLQEVLRRIGQLEERDRNQQLELDILRAQNAALVNDVSTMADELQQLKQKETQQSNRITILEEREKVLMEKFDFLAQRKPLKSTLDSKLSEPSDVQGATTDNKQTSIQNITQNFPRAFTNIVKNGKLHVNGHNRIRQAEAEQSVAFFATLTTHKAVLGQGQPIVFDNLITNNGNAYHKSTGVFTVPVSGVYVFSATIFNLGQNAHYEYNVNGHFISHMFVPSGGEHHTTSQIAILNLKKGDDVTVRNVDAGIRTYGDNYSSFSGFLLTTVGDGVSSIIG